ncbi:hypothetical protein LEP1GSC060_0350 [Leptospira weilii serovar Ranarum str. ICFT]|uniref:Uncharacterized protein n=1 Tax=Leptospira weilii serovar Ranarum str. ICFT TaxID=1218598 RepID=N1W8Q6_9LEPT|nr:hypothetical protein LEP1GSC060_0350 [Leptospira weilii serovar Ranarum str. ICFT]
MFLSLRTAAFVGYISKYASVFFTISSDENLWIVRLTENQFRNRRFFGVILVKESNNRDKTI